MYNESINSINLMRLNALYRDQRYANKRLMLLFNVKEKGRSALKLGRSILQLPTQGFELTSLQMQSFFKPSLIEDYRLEYSFDHDYEINYHSTGKKINGKIAVYTSVFGNYDPITEPFYASPYCDYFAITDQEIPSSSIWKKIDTNLIDGFNKMDGYHKSKFCKMFPHVLFPEYDFSIWVDGNVQIVADLYPLVDRMNETTFIGAFANPLHRCIYTEAKFNLVRNYANSELLRKQIELYRADGFPVNFGMREFSIIVREHKDPRCIDLMNKWWNEVNNYTMRDQISFPYILWKSGYDINTIQLLGEDWRWNPRFIWHSHNWHIAYNKKRSK